MRYYPLTHKAADRQFFPHRNIVPFSFVLVLLLVLEPELADQGIMVFFR